MFGWARSGSIVLLLVFTGAISGCTQSIPLSPEITTTRSAKIERFVGLYFPEETKVFSWKESRYGDTWVFPLGPPSVRAIKEAASRTFTRTKIVDQLPPLAQGTPNVDAVLEVRIEDFSFVIPMVKISTYSAEIGYRFTLYAPAGAPVATWRVDGEGEQRGQIGFDFTRWPGEAADLAIEDAMRKFIEEIDLEFEFRRWLLQSEPADSDIKPGV